MVESREVRVNFTGLLHRGRIKTVGIKYEWRTRIVKANTLVWSSFYGIREGLSCIIPPHRHISICIPREKGDLVR